MGNMDIYEKYRVVPKEAQKTIGAGRLKGFTDINPMWRIKALTEAFGPCGEGWYTVIKDKQLVQGSEGQYAAFMDIELYVKHGDEWSQPIFGTGGSMFVSNERNGPYTSDEAFKQAYTDAISVACKALGFGADVYWSGDRTKYDKKPVANKDTADIKCAECGKEITEVTGSTGTKSPEEFAELGRKDFGKRLCMHCYMKHKVEASQ